MGETLLLTAAFQWATPDQYWKESAGRGLRVHLDPLVRRYHRLQTPSSVQDSLCTSFPSIPLG